MENKFEYIINREVEEPKEEFKVDSDEMAEWVLKKISQERIEEKRYISVCKAMIDSYTNKIAEMQDNTRNKLAFFEAKLQEYFESVEHKATKTQETYKLPSGTLKLKYQQPEFIKDEEVLIKWLKENEYNKYFKTEEKLQWGELKKIIDVSEDKAITSDGEIIKGIQVIEKQPVFTIEV